MNIYFEKKLKKFDNDQTLIKKKEIVLYIIYNINEICVCIFKDKLKKKHSLL